MAELIYENAKYKHWFEEYNFEKCKLDRGEYGRFLANYLVGEHEGFVLNLNGSWGTGKTHFLRRLYTLLLNEMKHPVIYIDAWESDFSKDPLTVVSSELLTQLNALNSDIGTEIQTLKRYLGAALKGTLYGAVGFASKQLTDDASIGQQAVRTLIDDLPPESFVTQLSDGYQKQISAITNIREQLSLLAESLKTTYSSNLPVLVLVDELDRCRPTYAVELLEVIKHFFQTDHFVFVIASDTAQLSHSIKTIYGHDFSSEKYLKRFFDREAKLPKPDVHSYLKLKNLDYQSIFSSLNIAPKSVTAENFVEHLTFLIDAYRIDIRCIDSVIMKLNSCLRSIQSSPRSATDMIDIIMLSITIIEQHQGLTSYSNRTDGSELEEAPNLKHQNLSEDFSTRDMISCAFHMARTYYRTSDSNPRRKFEAEVPSEKYNHFFNDRSSSIRDRYVDGYINSLNNLRSTSLYRWRWSDYKELVELAKNLK